MSLSDELRRALDLPDLPVDELRFGAWEAAYVLGVGQSNLRTIANLPEPVQKLRMGALWRATDILRLAGERAARRNKLLAA